MDEPEPKSNGARQDAPRGDLAKLGLRLMFGSALASWMTATIAKTA